ncbi:MAG TPA: T9SS type A sorting domain-containing protein [Bacteroidota bacterium]|nr:T9SS type A sorting domain-containing protein [Bacteroidota bacterium]
MSENFDVTRLQFPGLPTVHSSNNPLPAPVVLPTNTFGAGVGNGTPSAEQWEGMLVQFNNVVVTDTFPTFQEVYEFGVSDGSGQVIIRRDGKHRYTTTVQDSVGKILIRQGQRISYLRGIVFYSGNIYKIVPRGDDDFGTITSVGELEHSSIVPDRFALNQNYPNPFNPTTTIQFALPSASHVRLEVFNLLGQRVETLVNGFKEAGTYTLQFDASDLPTGIYFYRLQAGQFVQTRKMILVR